MKLMKRVWAALLLLAASGQLYADEGMWVLKELNKQNLARMAELGFTPSYDQLYSETDPCVANAVVIFGGGCTGITVSNEGLIFTNHHCGFGAIQQLSSVEHDYLKDGFVSQSKLQVLEHAKREALATQDKTTLIGYEGMASNAYFEVLPVLILNQKADFPFHGRNRRPPKDAVNAMLSFAYTLIANDTSAALETVGLDPYVGFLHTLRPGRTSLALDMMEELRAYLGDRFVLSLINKRQITSKDFLFQGDNGVVMTDKGKKTFISAWQARKREVIIHPYLNEKIEIGLLPYVQAMLMARYIRQDIDNYPVFLIK